MGRVREAIRATGAAEWAAACVRAVVQPGPALVPVQVYASSGEGPLKRDRRETEQVRERESEEQQWPPEPAEPAPGWSIPKPEEIPQPTYWPVVMSVAITLIFWGIISAAVVAAVGVVLFALSLAGWIGDIRHEQSEH